MLILKITSYISFGQLSIKLDQSDSIAVDSSFIKSKEELNLAYHLTKKSTAAGNNISKQFRYEFLLWLSGKTDIKSAFLSTLPKGNSFLIISFGKKLPAIDGKVEKLDLLNKAKSLDLERISLSRI